MKIEIDLELPGIISKAVNAERLQPIIDKAVDEALKSSISEATGYRSEFRKGLEAQLVAAMPHGLRLDDVAKFQHLANAAFTDLVSRFNQQAVTAMLQQSRAIPLPDVPEVVKLSELLDQARNGLHVYYDDLGFYAHLRESTHSPGTHYLALDRDTSTSEYRAAYQLSISPEGEVYSLKLDGKQITPSFLPDVIGTFDAMLLSMYVGRSRLEIDVKEYDIELAATAPNERDN